MAEKSTREAFGEALLALAPSHPRVVVMNADLGKSTMTMPFVQKYPERSFNVGIAEANMLGIAAGLALSGYVPFVTTFATFVIGRFETLRMSVAYNRANVKIVGTHAGIGIGEDGYSQMALEDLACARSLPNIAIVQPMDEIETRQAVTYAAEHDGPVYLRLTRQKVKTILPPTYQFEFGRVVCLRRGSDVTIAGTGGVVANCLEAAELLKAEGIEAEVLNVHTIKPLDEEGLLASVARIGRVVTVEDHSVRGGLGGAVAELLAEVLPTPVKRLGVEGFGESGDPKGLYAKHGLDPHGIAQSVLKFLNR